MATGSSSQILSITTVRSGERSHSASSHTLKVATIVGARPQFVKAAPISQAIAEYNSHLEGDWGIEEVLVHTGQHYDYHMSQVFFDELDLSAPIYHLGVGANTHGEQTGE